MKRYIINEETLKTIADAIRYKTGESEDISVPSMSQKIRDIIPSDVVLEDLLVIPTGIENVIIPEEGVHGYKQVTVLGDINLIPENIKSGVIIYGVAGTLESDLESKLTELEITDNGEYLPEEGFLGFSKVNVNVKGTDGGIIKPTIIRVGSEKTTQRIDIKSPIIKEVS